jgi:hypothetical protein
MVERDPTYVASSMGSKFFGTELRETNHYIHFVLIITLRFDSSSRLSLSSLTYNLFELASKVIRID